MKHSQVTSLNHNWLPLHHVIKLLVSNIQGFIAITNGYQIFIDLENSVRVAFWARVHTLTSPVELAHRPLPGNGSSQLALYIRKAKMAHLGRTSIVTPISTEPFLLDAWSRIWNWNWMTFPQTLSIQSSLPMKIRSLTLHISYTIVLLQSA